MPIESGQHDKQDMDARRELGWSYLKQITGDKGEQTIARLRQFSPDLCEMIISFAYGDIYARPGLDLKQRMIVTLTTLITQGGCDKELEVHVGSALNVGLTPKEIVEIMLHCIPYIGFPKVMNAMGTAREVFEAKGIRLE
ncbi:MAG: carboxymuconolactone decarboxylase [Paenibacillus sp.]|nr:carboxymuconolactone decarboxylase [Paenibacillus sp.]